MTNGKILAVGLNSVLQKTLTFSEFIPAEINRAINRVLTAGGKGIHFVRAVNHCEAGKGIVAHFLGGQSGNFINSQMERQGLDQIALPILGESRMCTTLLCQKSSEMTEIIDPSPHISESEAAEMLGLIRARLPDCSAIALCGTYPPGVSADFYATLAREKGDSLLLMDACKGVDKTLAEGHVDVLKINLAELKELTGLDAVEEAAEKVFGDYGIKFLAITDGARRARLYTEDDSWSFLIPSLNKVVNPIGAGDTVGAVTLYNYLQNDDMVAAFASGLAAASASCMHIEGARFEDKDMQEILSQIIIS